jgi:hypothetical protein
MAIIENSMQPLFKKLQSSGFDSPYVKSLLPDWWDDSIANTPSGYQQATLLIARLLAIRPDSLWAEGGVPTFALPESRRFKHRADLGAHELDVACALAFSAARIVNSGIDHLPVDVEVPSAAELRRTLLQSSKWIGLPELLDYCYSIGIPVIYLEKLPAKAKKMDGLAFDCDGRATIVLTRRKKYGYLLFDLAHELGHIALKHVQRGGFIIDNTIGGDANDDDDDERAANRFAIELLTGEPDRQIKAAAANLTGDRLAQAALTYGSKHQIDPTHVAMNYGYTMQHWGVAATAVNKISVGQDEDKVQIKNALIRNLDETAMKEDDISALRGMVGLDT